MDGEFIPLHLRMLQNELADRKQRNYRYSLRAFAQFLGLGSSTLSRIFMNTQEISASNSKLIMDKLNFSEDDRMLFLASIAEEKRKRAFEVITNIFDKNVSDDSETEFYQISSDWLLSKSPEMIFVVNHLYQCLYVNEEGAKLYRKTPQELIGVTMRDLGIPAKVADALEKNIEKAFNDKCVVKFDDVESAVGGRSWMQRIYIPIFGKNDNVYAVACHVRDITDRKKVESQLKFLVDIGKMLSSSYDYKEKLEKVVDSINEKIADGCFVHIMNEKHEVEVFKVAHKINSKKEILRSIFARYPYEPDYPSFYHQVFKTGKTQFASEVSDELLKQICRNEEHYQQLKELDVKSYMCVPMISVNKVIGTMTLFRSSNEIPFDLNDLTLVKEVCLRAAWNIDCSMKLAHHMA